MASLQGWGRETWGSGAWGEYAPVAATGNGLTSSTATPTSVTGDCNITLTGVSGTSTAGTAVGTGLAVVNATGNSLTSSTNDVTTTANADVSPTANGLTSALGEGSSLVTTGAQSGWGRAFNGDTGEVIGWGEN